MELKNFAADLIDWSRVSESAHPGESGAATVRSHRLGDIQLRLVVYSPNYVADHWCRKGHIVYVVAGHLVIEHRHGKKYALTPGMTYHAADDDELPHRVLSKSGAIIFIVD
jgi:hypothetical protein